MKVRESGDVEAVTHEYPVPTVSARTHLMFLLSFARFLCASAPLRFKGRPYLPIDTGIRFGPNGFSNLPKRPATGALHAMQWPSAETR